MDTILLIANVALVIVTSAYVWLTQRMVKEMEAGRRQSLMPFLTVNVRSSAYEGDFDGAGNWIRVENIGATPAQDVWVHIEPHSCEGSRLEFKETTQGLQTIPIGQAKEFLLRSRDVKHYTVIEATLIVSVKYRNVYGVVFETTSYHRYGPWPNELGDEETDWTRFEEQVKILEPSSRLQTGTRWPRWRGRKS